jgi:RHS repeat-associated protein
VVSDESGNVADTLEYYPYGETRLNQPSYPTNAQRQYIAQFKDGNSLAYLNARYYDSARGQFLSEDPVFLGDPSQQNLQDPQSLNVYSYAENNPVTRKDPNGLAATKAEQIAVLQAQVQILQGIVGLYRSGSVQQANAAFGAYQTAFGSGSSQVSSSMGNSVTPREGSIVPIPDITSSLTKDMQEHASDIWINNPFYFKNKVQRWRLGFEEYGSIYNKDIYTEGFIFNERRIRVDAPGNIHYGYVGAATLWDQYAGGHSCCWRKREKQT